MSEIADRYRRLAEGFTARVAAVPPDDPRWQHRSPCEDWTARDIVAHMADTHHLFFGMVDHDAGAKPSPDEPPMPAWEAVRDQMQDALDDPDVAGREHDGMSGRSRFEDSADRFVNTDVLVHTWDLSRALGVDDRLPIDDVRRVRQTAEGYGAGMRAPGAFGPELAAPPDADEQESLMAFLGRRTR